MTAAIGETGVRLEYDACLRREYVDAMSALVGGVTIVTTNGPLRKPCGMTTTSTVSVSADPPMVAVAVNALSRTLAGIRATGEFMVNVLVSAGQEAAQLFATAAADKFREVEWERSPEGLPWLPTLCAHALHCEVASDVPAADHAVVLGYVRAVLPGRPDGGDEQPSLAYCRRGWHAVGEPKPTPTPGLVGRKAP